METKHDEQLRNQIMRLLYQLEPQQIWRPVIGPWGQDMVPGLHPNDNLLYSTPGLDLRGKSVADFGCNLGFYTFQFRRMGAAKVLGVDIDPGLIDICGLLAEYLHIDRVEFRVMDILEQRPEKSYDITVMIDVIGKQFIRSGMLRGFLDAMAHTADKEMFFTLRPIYKLAKHDLGPEDELERRYPGGYLRQGRFHLLELVRDYFAKDWEMRIPAEDDYWELSHKYPTHFIRR
jgi:SAM-dependent methyltransferase